MSELNFKHNRAVWFDIPVADLQRANDFYAAVLACGVEVFDAGGVQASFLEHDEGNGGCLVPKPEDISSDKGLLVYLNVDGRIREASRLVSERGGQIVEDVHSIGPHGFRAVVLDSEGNRVALHSTTDA